MDDGDAALVPSAAAIEERLLLDYGVDTAKLMVRRVSHDFNNLIAVVRGYAGVLQGKPGLDEDIKEMARLIDQAGFELASLTDRLARFADDQGYERSSFDLNSVITDFVIETRDLIPPGIEVETQLGSLMPTLWGDARLMGELCQKLWQNAIDSMPHGGRLCFTTSTQHSAVGIGGPPTGAKGQGADGSVPATYLRIRVTDTGVGMDEETRVSMLQPFFTTKAGRGRGLGATVVYEAVKFHGGYLSVSSELGNGTTVDIHLPVPEPYG